MSSSIKSSFTFKVAVVSLLCLADIAVNAIADHKTSWPDSYTPFALMGVQLMFQLCVLRRRATTRARRTTPAPTPTPTPTSSPRSVAFIMLLMLFSGTYLFQVGLLNVLFHEFRGTMLSMGLYLVVYVIYMAVKISFAEKVGNDGLWSLPGFVLVSVLQKLAALGYYVSLLAACSRLGEAIWYSQGPWVTRYSATDV